MDATTAAGPEDFTTLVEGRRIRFTDRGFGDLLAHPRDGDEATICVPYRRDQGLVVRFDDGAMTWIHPTEASLLDGGIQRG